MTMPTDKGHGLTSSLWARLSVLMVVALILVVVAARYVW